MIEYTTANRLAINPEKTQIMLQTNDQTIKDKFTVTLNGKEIRHKKEIIVLGNLLSDSLTWDAHVKKILLSSLRNRVRTLRMIAKYMDRGFRAIFANSVFRSCLMFGLETWGGALKTQIKDVQKLQVPSLEAGAPEVTQQTITTTKTESPRLASCRK